MQPQPCPRGSSRPPRKHAVTQKFCRRAPGFPAGRAGRRGDGPRRCEGGCGAPQRAGWSLPSAGTRNDRFTPHYAATGQESRQRRAGAVAVGPADRLLTSPAGAGTRGAGR